MLSKKDQAFSPWTTDKWDCDDLPNVNENEIIVFAIRRSGQHAIINWIAGLYDKPIYFFNNVNIGYSPYWKTLYKVNREGSELEKLYHPYHEEYPEGHERRKKMMKVRKEVLMYNYETKDISKYKKPNTGGSKRVFHVLILRDFPNLIASSLFYPQYWRYEVPPRSLADEMRKRSKKHLTIKFDDARMIKYRTYRKVNVIINCYKKLAYEYLGKTNYIRYEKIWILYNRWFSDKNYRDEIAEKLNRINKDRTIHTLASVQRGGGSSFDFKKFDKDAQTMDVLNRWKVLEENPIYREVLSRDKEVISLSREIFNGS